MHLQLNNTIETRDGFQLAESIVHFNNWTQNESDQNKVSVNVHAYRNEIVKDNGFLGMNVSYTGYKQYDISDVIIDSSHEGTALMAAIKIAIYDKIRQDLVSKGITTDSECVIIQD